MKRLSTLLFLCISYNLFAQDYTIASIPDSLTKNAHAVKRHEELHIVIKSINKAVIKHTYAITILNEEGDDFAEYSNSYNKLKDLSDISGTLYDALGKKMKTVKKRDIEDVSYQDGFSLMRDDRIKKHNFYCKQYPYTVEYEDEQQLNGIFILPAWHPVEGENYAVQQSKFIIETPSDYQLRYKQLNYRNEPVISKNSTDSIYTWEIKNTQSFSTEVFGPAFSVITPSVYIAPTNFSIGGYIGNMSTWLNLGKFILDLNRNKDALPQKVKQDVHQLVAGLTDTKQKIDILYRYLQNNTRYIYIKLGLGGWQPFDATYVATNRYGDCKALSNYMVSLLKEAGIKANYVLINSGDNVSNGLWEDFPSPYFNHAIACVPYGKDTLWLECTSQTNPAGYMGSFTGNRKALLIDDDGGHIVTTPIYTAKNNLQLRSVNATIDKTGNLSAEVNTHFTGIQQELQHALIHDANKEQRDKYLNNVINLPTYSVDSNDYKETPGIIPSIDEHLDLKSSGYATISGKRLFIQPNLFNKSNIKLYKDTTRKLDINYPYGFKDVDTIRIEIPVGYVPESVPKNITINSQFGNYSISFTISENKIELLRTQQSDAAYYPATDYTELVKFYNDIYRADRSKIVFVKKEN